MSSEIEMISPIGEKEDFEPLSSEKLFQIRRYLLILVTIQWIVCIINLVVNIYSVITENEQDDISNKIGSLIPILTLTLYYTYGLLFIYKYHRIGILIFSLIGMLLFIITCVFIINIIFAILALGLDFNNIIIVVRFFFTFGLIFGTFVCVGIVTLNLAFNLAGLIKTNGYTIV